MTVSDGDTEIGTATVGPDGTWTLTPATPLAPGTHTITATQVGPGGAASGPSAPVIFTIVADAPLEAPTITSPEPGSTTPDRAPTITGQGEPGATVTVRDGDAVLGAAPVGPDGTWSLALGEPLACGEHALTVFQTDAAGLVSPTSSPVSFQVACSGGGADSTGGAGVQAADASGGSTTQLAQTGVPLDTWLMGLLGLLLLVGGAALLTRAPAMR